MARHIWTVVCQTVITDQVTNSVSYIQSVEGITVVALPTPAPSFVVGTLWESEGADALIRGRARILAPDGSVAAEIEHPSRDLSVLPRLRQNALFSGFPVSVEGMYTAVVEQMRSGEWVHEFSVGIPVRRYDLAEVQRLTDERLAAASR